MVIYCRQAIKRKAGEALNSFIKWVGGKYLLRNQILQEFPQDLSCYVEMFGGAAWVLFAREKHTGTEVYNDVNHNLVNLFRCVKYHADELYKELKWSLISRDEFLKAKEEVYDQNLTDIQRAARFFLLVRCSFGAKMETFNGKRAALGSITKDLESFSERLRSTIIEQLDFERLVSLYDSRNTLFYADPPYYEAEGYYAEQFCAADHLRLREVLAGIDGKFILTYNDCPYIRELYGRYEVIPIERQNNMTSCTTKKGYQEIIIKNF